MRGAMIRQLGTPALIALALVLRVPALTGQVTVAPTNLHVSDRAPIGTFLVSNQSDQAQEVSIDFRFGYPVSDSLGDVRMEWDDEDAAARHSLDPWIHAFPRRFVVQPGQRQTVRMMTRPPRGLTEGVYWTRVVTTSSAPSAPPEVAAAREEENVILRFQQITTVFLQSGTPNSGVEVGDVRTAVEDGALVLHVPLERRGMSPFFGVASVSVSNERGEVVLEEQSPVTIYFSIVHRFSLDRSELPAGAYSARIDFDPAPGVTPDAPPGPSPTSRTIALTLP